MSFTPPATLILLRHGQSQWNESNQFTGWYDCALTAKGEAEARASAAILTGAGIAPDVVHTSLQTRAIRTAELCLAEMDRSWIPVRRSWRLNERHYGDLTGLDKSDTKAAHGEEKLNAWRRGYRTPPPPISPDNAFNPNHDERYRDLPPELIPAAECLADVVDRMLPYWYDGIVPDLLSGHTVLLAAHGNSLRALCKHLNGIGDDDIAELNIPTGMPLRYELGSDLMPIDDIPVLERALDPDAAAAAAEAVKNQANR